MIAFFVIVFLSLNTLSDTFTADCKVRFANRLVYLLIAWKRAIITEKFP